MERIISISGQLENMCKAEVLISQKLRQCFESDYIQYQQQSYLYSGFHSPIPPLMPPQSGPLNLASGYGHQQPPLSYTLGTPPNVSPMMGRPSTLATTH